MNSKKSKSFTLLELLIVVGLIAALSAFLMSTTNRMSSQNKVTQTRKILADTAKAIEAFRADWGELPETLEYLTNVERQKQLAEAKGITKSDLRPYIRQEITEDSVVFNWICTTGNGAYIANQNSEIENNFGGESYHDHSAWGLPLNSIILRWVPYKDFGVGDFYMGDIGIRFQVPITTDQQRRIQLANFWYPILDGWGNPILYLKRQWVSLDGLPLGGGSRVGTSSQWKDNFEDADQGGSYEIFGDGTYMLYSAGPDFNINVTSGIMSRTFVYPEDFTICCGWDYSFMHQDSPNSRYSHGFARMFLNYHHINTGWRYLGPLSGVSWYPGRNGPGYHDDQLSKARVAPPNDDIYLKGYWIPIWEKPPNYNPLSADNVDNIYHEGTPRAYNYNNPNIS